MSTPAIQPAARSTLVSLVEEHLTGLIRESVQVQRHCKRARLHVNGGSATIKRRLHAEDINLALQWRGSEKIYATPVVPYSRDDKKVHLESYLQSELEMRPPQEVALGVHWLAVDGIQPDVPQNPGSTTVHTVEDDEAPVTDSNITSTSAEEGIHVTQLLPKLLSEELQLYFARITTAVERGSATKSTRQQQDAALKSVSKDAGLQELVPFLVNYVSKSLFKNVGSPDHCRTLVRLGRCLLQNPHLHLELHLHQLLPTLLTCVVAERLATKPWENHWSLRQEAASTLVQACHLYGDDYSTLKARVLKTLCDAAGPDKALATQYGGFMGISFFGPKAINAFLLPLAMDYWKAWENKLGETSDLQQRLELYMCQQAVLDALGLFLAQDYEETPENLRMSWDELEDTFGDRLVMLSNEETDYMMCVV